jgi:histidine triad (HIT) family protein
MSDPSCIFCKIARGKISAQTIYEDEDLVAFHDIHPVAPVHFLVIPRMHIPSLAECDASHAPLLGKLFAVVSRLAREQGSVDGFRTIVNTGRVGRQEVYHLHVHVLGGPAPLPAMLRRD